MRLFLVHDQRFFVGRLSPALAASSCRRSFLPIVNLVSEIHETLRESAARDRLTRSEEPLLFRCHSLRFDRRLWRHLAGELLLYAAAETPAFPTAPEVLAQLMDPEFVERIHDGSRDVLFAGVPYRIGQAGMHEGTDAAQLATQLSGIRAEEWRAERLADVPPEERLEELAFARQCLEDLQGMFERAEAKGRVIVCEEV
jgi:hypothetical protein